MKIGSDRPQHHCVLRGALLRVQLRICLCLSLISLSACTNNLNLNSYTSSNGSNSIIVSPPNSGEGDGNSATFTVSRVVKNTLNPTSVLDIIGDGSGSFGSLCQPSGNDTSSSGPTVCQCSYSYSTSSAPNQHIYTPIVYHEVNLLRCSYANVPSDAINLSVSINILSANANSNSVTLNLAASGGTNIDVTNPNSFVQPIRYQCRDIVWIPYLFDSSIYDPFQSEDPHMSYPIDFYASNLGSAISQYVSSNITSWNCPAILNPVPYLTPTALTQFNETNRVNLNLYSKAPLPGGGELIYPPDGSIDRSTFYLARQPAGVFSVPVNAMMFPGKFTSQGGSGPQPLGYGAHPVPIGVGTGLESCDTSTTIPVGFHWMKLWLFRAGLPQRHYAISGGQGPSINELQNIACSPGDWGPDSSNTPVFPQCDQTLSHSGTSRSLKEITANHFLADRILGSGQCIRFDSTANNSTAANFCNGTPGAACGVNGNDDDVWQIENAYIPRQNEVGCLKSPHVDPMKVCPNPVPTPVSTSLPAITSPQPVTPQTYNVGTGDLDSPNAAARFDFVFVVTPPTVNTTDMQDISSGSTSLPYQPYRFFTNSDCTSPQPGLTGPGDCLLSNAINNYGLKLHDVGTSGDPPANTTNQPVFPVCVLQPDLGTTPSGSDGGSI